MDAFVGTQAAAVCLPSVDDQAAMETYNSFVFLVSILTNMASFKAAVLNSGGFCPSSVPPRGRLTISGDVFLLPQLAVEVLLASSG